MSGPEFFQTPMGRKFFERDLPELITQLSRLATSIERLSIAKTTPPTTLLRHKWDVITGSFAGDETPCPDRKVG